MKIIYFLICTSLCFNAFSLQNDALKSDKELRVETMIGVYGPGWYKKYRGLSYSNTFQYKLNKFSFLIGQFGYSSYDRTVDKYGEKVNYDYNFVDYYSNPIIGFNPLYQPNKTVYKSNGHSIGLGALFGLDLLWFLDRHRLITAFGANYVFNTYVDEIWGINNDGTLKYYQIYHGSRKFLTYTYLITYTFDISDRVGVGIREFNLGSGSRYRMSGVGLHCSLKL